MLPKVGGDKRYIEQGLITINFKKLIPSIDMIRAYMSIEPGMGRFETSLSIRNTYDTLMGIEDHRNESEGFPGSMMTDVESFDVGRYEKDIYRDFVRLNISDFFYVNALDYVNLPVGSRFIMNSAAEEISAEIEVEREAERLKAQKEKDKKPPSSSERSMDDIDMSSIFRN